MGILFLLIGIAVIGGAALLISGRWRDGLPDEEAQTSPPLGDVPLGQVDIADVDAVRMDQAVRGYRMDEVDALVTRLSDEIAVRDDELRRLRAAEADDTRADDANPA
jgi:DivIVA domain-containing protein